MNYGEVKTQFSALLNRRDCTPTQTETFLQQGFERIQRELRIPAMEKAVQVTVDEQYDDLIIPSDYLGFLTLTIEGDPCNKDPLERRSLKDVRRAQATMASPRIFCRRVGKFLLGPYPVSGTVLRLDYYAEYPGVTEDTDENIITIICPTLAVYSGLSYAGDHFKDKRRDDWEGRYGQIRDELHSQGADDELSDAAVSASQDWPCDD